MNNEELIAKYFSNSLSEAEKIKFDNLLDGDPIFAETFKFENDLKQAIKKEEQDKFRAKLKSLNDNSSLPKKFAPQKWLIAASIILLLGIPIFLFFSNNSVDNNALYTKHFQPYDNVVYPIVRGDVSKDTLSRAFIAYEAKNYNEALLLFNDLLAVKKDSNIIFYKAIIKMEQGKYNEAIELMESNNAISEQLNYQQQWFLGLAYLKTDQNTKAIKSFESLEKHGGFKTKEAQLILNDIAN